MTSSGAIVTSVSQLKYHRDHPEETQLTKDWNSILKKLPEDLREEAKKKGFKIVDNPHIEDDGLAKYMLLEVPESSEELNKYLEDKMLKYVICLKE